ncbi:carbonic anhydrase 1-like [Ruditapes philippinarum]|uniref:carbonic anhydrase 1-like n=1 Tax=Ruditapes philippinarum TaxID=129788 RepID=UPI00295BBA6B|nr:carbonic anhydrase 1-like [Ruditapes philippinarum]
MEKIAFGCLSIFLLLHFVPGSGQEAPRPPFQVLIPDVSYWAYGNNDHGPMYWPGLFPNYCAGIFQSPINIETSKTVYNPNLKEFAIFYDPPLRGSKFEVHNNGHAVEVNTDGSFYISNGGLRYLYKTAQFHFHWGSQDAQGSEHTIDGERYPLEMHVVNWNSDKYKSSDEAGKHREGLAVLSILFKVSSFDNPTLEPIVRVLHQLRDPDRHVLVTIPAVSIKEFLPQSPDRYFRYAGSLTTPNCSETVIWTIFEQNQYISERQLRHFREMFTSSLHIEARTRNRVLGEAGEWRALLSDNFRPVHNLNGRTVFRSFQHLPLQSGQTCNPRVDLDIKLRT